MLYSLSQNYLLCQGFRLFVSSSCMKTVMVICSEKGVPIRLSWFYSQLLIFCIEVYIQLVTGTSAQGYVTRYYTYLLSGSSQQLQTVGSLSEREVQSIWGFTLRESGAHQLKFRVRVRLDNSFNVKQIKVPQFRSNAVWLICQSAGFPTEAMWGRWINPWQEHFLFVYNEDKVFAENFVSMFSYINALLSIGLENRMTS